MSIVKSNEIESGECPKVYKLRLLQYYKEKYGCEIRLYYCYEFARERPRFLFVFDTAVITETSEVLASIEEKKCKAGIAGSANRPVGTKKAKKMKQEDELAERLAKKFGVSTVSSPSNNDNLDSDLWNGFCQPTNPLDQP